MTRSKNPTNCKMATHMPLLLWKMLGLPACMTIWGEKSADLKSLWVWVAVCSLLLQRLHVLSSRDSESLLMSIWCHAVIKMDDRETEMLKPHILCLYRPNLKCTYLKMASCPRKDMKSMFSPLKLHKSYFFPPVCTVWFKGLKSSSKYATFSI